MIKLHGFKPKVKKRKKKRVGRGPGSGKGTYSGRGIKGQKARSGYKIPAPSLITKLPKLRGEGFKKVKTQKIKVKIVNLENLDKHYKTNEEVSLKSLIEKGIVDKATEKVKILAKGKLSKKLKFAEDLFFSQKAKTLIKDLCLII